MNITKEAQKERFLALAAKLKAQVAAQKAEQENNTLVVPTIPAVPVVPATISSENLLAKALEAAKNRAKQLVQEVETGRTTEREVVIAPIDRSAENKQASEGKVYNTEQQAFIDIASALLTSRHKGVVLIGAAGTGKTTCTRGAVESLMQSPHMPSILDTREHKWLRMDSPGIVAVAYTRRATNNIRRALPANLSANCMTIHRLLEYQPTEVIVEDKETGEDVRSMRFLPGRTYNNKLPGEIQICIIDEASMVSVSLFRELEAALPDNCKFIFIGDLNQLPPTFGDAILGYKIGELPCIELKQVYRQALDSPIIRLAHGVLKGTGISGAELARNWEVQNKLQYYIWKKKIAPEHGLGMAALLFTMTDEQRKAVTTVPQQLLNCFASYDPELDMILCPYNKAFGTIELNKHIAQNIARKEKKLIYEVIAGREKFYCSIGDKVLIDREDAVILGIEKNAKYTGKTPQTESYTLDYWGVEHDHIASSEDEGDKRKGTEDYDYLHDILDAAIDDRVTQASHIIKVRMLDKDIECYLSTAAQMNGVLHAYALTVHKSQGSEYRKVFLVLHNSHATGLCRELLYTAVTRAKEELYIICEEDTFVKGIERQRIKGNTLEEKAEYFKGKKEIGE